MVLMEPSGRISLTALSPLSATKTSPAASTATLPGVLKPEPRMVARVGVKVRSVGYWTRAGAVDPAGWTVRGSVAPAPRPVRTAAPVPTGGTAGVRRSSRTSRVGRNRHRRTRRGLGDFFCLRRQNERVIAKLLELRSRSADRPRDRAAPAPSAEPPPAR